MTHILDNDCQIDMHLRRLGIWYPAIKEIIYNNPFGNIQLPINNTLIDIRWNKEDKLYVYFAQHKIQNVYTFTCSCNAEHIKILQPSIDFSQLIEISGVYADDILSIIDNNRGGKIYIEGYMNDNYVYTIVTWYKWRHRLYASLWYKWRHRLYASFIYRAWTSSIERIQVDLSIEEPYKTLLPDRYQTYLMLTNQRSEKRWQHANNI